MRMFALVAAGLVAVSALPIASADAQTRVVRTTTVTTTARPVAARTVVTTHPVRARTVVTTTQNRRGTWHRAYQTRRGTWHRASWRNNGHSRWRTVCNTTWRHHHRVRTCHQVRRWS